MKNEAPDLQQSADQLQAAPVKQAEQRQEGEKKKPERTAGARDTEMLQRHFYSHFRDLQRQAALLKQTYPDLDLNRELQDPVFSRLTSPGVGLSVEDAYYAVHRKQLQEQMLRTAAQQVTEAIASGAGRPRENGLNRQAPAVTGFDYRNATKQQREDLKRNIRQAAAQGKKLFPGR